MKKRPARELNEKLEQRVAGQSSDIRENEQRLGLALQEVGGGAWDWSLVSGEAWWSPEMYELWGAPPGTRMFLDNSLAMVHEQDRAGLRQAIEAAIARQGEFYWKFRIQHPRRGERTLCSHGRLVFDEYGKVTRMRGVTIDVTERRRDELALLENEKKLRAILAAAIDAIIMIDKQGRITDANPATERLFGYTCGELMGRHVNILIAQPDSGEHGGDLSRLLQTGGTKTAGISRDIEGRRRSGEVFPLELSMTEVAVDGQSAFTMFIRDISRRKRAEEELRREHELNEGIIKTSQHIVLLLDRDGRIIRFNPYLEELTGWRLDEVKGKDWFDTFLPGHDRKKIKIVFDRAIKGTRTRANANPIIARDGREIEIEWYDSPLTDADGRLIGLLCTGQDVTVRKRAEDTLRKSHELLELHVKERTNELEAARREAERANTSKSRFLATASHDLRQPLQSIGMYLSVLAREPGLAPSTLAISDKMHKSLAVINHLLDALLDISQLESGSVNLDIKDFPVMDLLDRVIADNLPHAETKGLRLAYHESNCRLRSDPMLLERALENLVTNAIRYTERGGVTVDCRCEGDSALLTVTDTGIGIPPEKLHLIFEEYYQLDNPLRDRSKGLGLGLSIVNHIAALLDHPLEVHSVPGRGSTFSIAVPMSDTHVKHVAGKPPAGAAQGAQAAPVVLLVEDDPAVSDATKMLLETENFKVHCAGSGDEAMQTINQGVRPDVLVCDYRLPGESGIEVIRRVRKACSADTPAVLLSGDATVSLNNKNEPAECVVLLKPVEPDRLIALLRKVRSPGTCAGDK